MSARFAVRVSSALHPLLREMKRLNGTNPRCAEAILYRTICVCIENVVSNPEHAMESRYRLTGDLSGIRRVKLGPQSRHRLFFITNPDKGTSTLLWVGYRKKGDSGDAYTDMRKRVARGMFDEELAELGIKRPS